MDVVPVRPRGPQRGKHRRHDSTGMSRGWLRPLAPITPPEERVLVTGECRKKRGGVANDFPAGTTFAKNLGGEKEAGR